VTGKRPEISAKDFSSTYLKLEVGQVPEADVGSSDNLELSTVQVPIL
jgi:hypothetical protein